MIKLRWGLVGLFFVLLIGLALWSRQETAKPATGVSSEESMQIRMALQMRSVGFWLQDQGQAQSAAQYFDNANTSLKTQEEALQEKPLNAERAAMIGALRTIREQKLSPALNLKLQESKKPEMKAAARILFVRQMPEQEAREAAAAVRKLPDSGPILAALALERAGEKNALAREFPASGFIPLVIMIGVALVGLCAGAIAWILYFTQKNKPGWALQGHPFDRISADQASKLGLLSVGIIGLFQVVQVVVELGFQPLPDAASMFLSTAIFLAALGFILQTRKINGNSLMSWMNQSKFSLGKQVGIGVLGWAANIPIFVVLLPLVNAFARETNASHPITEMIAEGGGVWPMLAFFFAGAIAAPLWEEVVFRGTLLGGLRRIDPRWKFAIPGSILISSFVFAAIHPQGPALWLMLGWIGAMGCFLTYFTRSIIPAIVMHAVHNGLLLLMSMAILG